MEQDGEGEGVVDDNPPHTHTQFLVPLTEPLGSIHHTTGLGEGVNGSYCGFCGEQTEQEALVAHIGKMLRRPPDPGEVRREI